jgi:hypothetical protein
MEQNNWLDNPKIWRNARGGALVVVLLISPLIYFGIMDNFSINNFLNYEFGGLIIFMTLMNLLTVFEIRHRAFEDELDFDKSIVELENTLDKNGIEIRKNISIGIQILSEHNIKLQKSYNKQKTNLIIEKLRDKRSKLEIRITYAILFKSLLQRKFKRIGNKIEKLEQVPKRDRRFKPYRFDRLLKAENISRYKRVGDNDTKSNPKKLPLLGSLIKMPVKGFTMSLGGMFIMLFVVNDPVALFKFYLWFIVIMAFTVVSQYILTRFKTKTRYKRSLEIKIQLQEIVLKGIKEESNEYIR